MCDLAPICLFTYNRIEPLKMTINSLQKNYLSSSSKIYIFSDGPRNKDDCFKIEKIREYLRSLSGFRYIKIIESDVNKGLANSIISGVSNIISQFGRVIVLEDDLFTSKNFLNFMNQALSFYQSNKKIFSVSGYSFDLPFLQNYSKDIYLAYRASSWGWGTWHDRWCGIDWNVTGYKNFKWNISQKIRFMRGGSDMPCMLKNQMNGRIDSWAIRLCFDQFLKNQYTVFPSNSKVICLGFGEHATHTKKTKRFTTGLGDGTQQKFTFDHDIIPNKILVKQFREKFSVWSRLKDKFQNLI